MIRRVELARRRRTSTALRHLARRWIRRTHGPRTKRAKVRRWERRHMRFDMFANRLEVDDMKVDLDAIAEALAHINPRRAGKTATMIDYCNRAMAKIFQAGIDPPGLFRTAYVFGQIQPFYPLRIYGGLP